MDGGATKHQPEHTLVQRWLWFKLATIVVVGVTFCVMLISRFPGVNGTRFLRWSFHWENPWRIYPAMLVAALPVCAAQWVGRRVVALGLLMASCLALQLVAVGMRRDPWSLDPISRIVSSPIATSYFDDALYLNSIPSIRTWLGAFPMLSKYCSVHARQKPPCQILYYLAWIRAYGNDRLDRAALMSGLCVAAAATFGVATTYGLSRVMGFADAAAFAAATCFALLPGMVLISPGFDQVHAAFTGLIVGSWIVAVSRKGISSWLAAVSCGLIIALSSFLAYSPLTLGALCAAIALHHLNRGRISFRRLAALVGAAAAVLIVPYVFLWLWSAFDPISMFLAARINEQTNLRQMDVPHTYPLTLPADLKDFMLAEGWIGLPLILFAVARRGMRNAAMLWMCAGQILIVWASGLLRAETARIWLFLQPLALIMIGAELQSWPRWARVATYLMLVVVTACMAQNLLFLG